MKIKELEAWSLCRRVEQQLNNEYAHEDPDYWTALYITRIRENLDVEVEEARLYLQSTPYPLTHTVHGYRRRISIYHEHIQLHAQGPRAVLQACTDLAMVSLGRG